MYRTGVICGTEVIVEVERGLWIPPDPSNMDYHDYLAWLAEGNEPGVWPPEEVGE